MLATYLPRYNQICMGGCNGLNETCSSGDSHYLYENLIQVTWPSRYGVDLAKTGLVIARLYCSWKLDRHDTRLPV